MENRYTKTGLTKEDLLSLLSEAGFHMTEAYALLGRDRYQDTARNLLDAWKFLLEDYLGDDINLKANMARKGTKKRAVTAES